MLSRGMIWETIQGHYVGNMIYGDELCSLEYIYINRIMEFFWFRYAEWLSNSLHTLFSKNCDLYYICFSVKLGVQREIQ